MYSKPQSPAKLNHRVQPSSTSIKTIIYTHNPTPHPSPSQLLAPSSPLLQSPLCPPLVPLTPSKPLTPSLSSQTLIYLGPIFLASRSRLCISFASPHLFPPLHMASYTSVMIMKTAIMMPMPMDCAGVGVVGLAWGETVGHCGCVGGAG